MPEGDTISRTARTLEWALSGRKVTAFETSAAAVQAAAERHKVVGSVVSGIESRGKHLLIRFESGAALHSHMGMRGSWHLYKRDTWRKKGRRARVSIEAGDVVAACFSPLVLALLSSSEVRHHPTLTRLGPDAAAASFDPLAARERLRHRAALEIGVAVLDQTALAGVGNVYKSEVLFLCGVNPFVPVADLHDGILDRIVRTASEQLKRNLGSRERRTTSSLAPGNLWVYSRAGLPCRRCGAAIRRAYQGELRRSTYWCPECQPVRIEAEPPPQPA